MTQPTAPAPFTANQRPLQLKDYTRYAKEQGKEFVLYIKEGMNQAKDLSAPLRKQIKLGNIIVKTYKFTKA